MKPNRSHPCRSALVPMLVSWMIVSNAAWHGIEAASSSQGEPGLQVAVVVAPGAPELERFAARELRRYLYELYGTSVSSLASPSPAMDLNILLGSPETNPAVADTGGKDGWPKVSDQGMVLRRVSAAGNPALVLGGGSPEATLWAVYEFVERAGVRFLLEKDVLPQEPEPFPPRDLDLILEPRFRFRSYRAINNLATSLIFYGMKDYRHLIDQLAKLKFNVLYAQTYPHQPFVHYQFRDQPKVTGVLHYGWKIPIHLAAIGRHLFGGRSELINPDFVGAKTYQDRLRAGQNLLQELFAYARRRGMQTGLNFRINQFTNEFNWRLPEWSDHEYVPRSAMKGKRSARLGISEYAVDPTAFPYMTPDNPVVVELNKTIIRAHIDTYPDVDFYGWTQPELPVGGQQFRQMWNRLNLKYKLEPDFSLEEMEESARTNTLPIGVRRGDRPLHELRGAIANAYTLDKLVNEDRILAKSTNPDASIVVSTFSDEFYPVMPRIFPNAILMVQMDYLTSLAAQRTEMLSFAAKTETRVMTLATLADDNVGVLPQLPTQPLHRILDAMDRYDCDGFFGRQFLVTKLEAGTAYLAKASWSAQVTPEWIYRDQVKQVCGQGSVAPMMQAYQLLEEATLKGDEVAMGFLFPVPNMMSKHWQDLSGPVAGWDALRAYYMKAVPLVQSALQQSRPEGKSYLQQLLGQLRFGTDYIAVVQAVRKARVKYEASQKARTDRDLRTYEKHIRESHGILEGALAQLKTGIQHWAGAVRDPSDLGALGVLNYFCYDYLKGVALNMYLEMERWSIQF